MSTFGKQLKEFSDLIQQRRNEKFLTLWNTIYEDGLNKLVAPVLEWGGYEVFVRDTEVDGRLKTLYDELRRTSTIESNILGIRLSFYKTGQYSINWLFGSNHPNTPGALLHSQSTTSRDKSYETSVKIIVRECKRKIEAGEKCFFSMEEWKWFDFYSNKAIMQSNNELTDGFKAYLQKHDMEIDYDFIKTYQVKW